MRRRILLFAPLALVGLTVFIALGGAIVRWLWNWLLPPLFGWPALTFWQALALLALCRILFGGFGGMRGHRHMSREQRERFRRGVGRHFGFDRTPGEGEAQPG